MHCKNCKGNFDPPPNIQIKNCPFCQTEIIEEKVIDPNTIEGKMQGIVNEYTDDIYKQPKRLKALVGDLLFGEDNLDLLKKIIDEDASFLAFNLLNKTSNDLSIEYQQSLESISKKSFIPKDIIDPAFKVLCLGLGLEITLQNEPVQQQVQQQVQQPVQQQVQQQVQQNQSSPLSDFVITNGKLLKYKGFDSIVVIPNSVTCIGDHSFQKSRNLTTVTIPNSVKTIEYWAFAECKRLTSITIPNSVTAIGKSAFFNCMKLDNVIIPDSITCIENATFQSCERLTTITIPNSITNIDRMAFISCLKLSNLILPNSVNSIGKGAFWNCESLSKDIVNQIKSIEPKAFKFTIL